MTNLRRGDIVFTQGTGWLSRAIRFFSRTGGESRTKVNHVGIITGDGSMRSATIVEALSTVKRRKMIAYHNGKTKVAIFRPTALNVMDRFDLLTAANSYVGRKYGYLKLVAHLLDWFLGGRYFFRRFAFMDRYPICSWVVAQAYSEAGYTFGVEPGAASPDDIWDFCVKHNYKYDLVYPLDILPE